MNIKIVWTDLIAVAIAAVLAWSHFGGTLPDLNFPLPAPAVEPVATPSAEMQEFVAPLKPILSGHEKSGEIAAFYRECAAEVEQNQSLSDLTKIRAFNAAAGAAMIRRVGAVSGMGDKLNESLKAVVGDDPVAVDAKLRSRLVEWYLAVAWAAEKG